ncbi:MAG: condensation domain-containing protein, partial [Acidobacteriota bacterium]
MRGLSKRLASLSPQQRELLQHRLKDRGLAASNLPILPRTEKRSSFPLTFAQERVWFLHQMEPEDPAYHIAVSRRLQGPLDVAALQRTFGEIVRRHESLRSGFSAVDGKPLQVVRPAPGLRIPRIDLSRLPESRQHAETRRLLREQNRRPFDLVCDPLLRCSLFRLTAEDHVLALSLHHIVTDGWSMEVLLREVQTLYEAFARGRPSPLPELPIQYGDFVLWQRQRVDGQLVADQLAYWRQQLAGLPPRLDLPTDRPRPAIRSYRGSVRGIALGAELTSALKTLSRSEETTLFVALLAVFKLLLGRTSGQPDLCVGIPISGRDRVEIEGLIGFFANTLVVRSSTLGGSTFGDFLSRVHRAVLDAHKHQDLPFERLVEELQPERSLSYPSIFQVMFAMQPRRLQAPVPDGSPSLNIAPYRSELAAATYDLSLEVVETGAGIRGVLSYNTDLFDATTVARMLSHLKALLEAVVVDPERRISDLPMLSPPERQALLREWNATASSPAEACAHQLFEAQAEQAPEAVALVWGERWLTYRELNRRANRLARALRGRGVAPEVVVGVLLERSPELVTAVLGVLKAGGAYLPLDPAQPAKRLAFMVDDAGVPILVTEPPLSQELRLESSPAVIGLDGAGSLAAGSEEAPSLAALRGNLTGGAVGENLAYLIYTSGSTGRPKGTELRHAGLLNLITWHQEVYRVAPGDRATLVASPGFDASVWEIWPNLTAGATLHIPASSTVASPPDLLAWLAARGITLSFLPTPLAEALLTEPLPPRLSLRALLTGGDKLHHSPERALPFDLVNHYGPTESTVVTSWTP